MKKQYDTLEAALKLREISADTTIGEIADFINSISSVERRRELQALITDIQGDAIAYIADEILDIEFEHSIAAYRLIANRMPGSGSISFRGSQH